MNRDARNPMRALDQVVLLGRPPDFEQLTHSERDSQDAITMPRTPERIDMQEASPAKLVGIFITRRPRRILLILSDIRFQGTLSQFQRLRLWLV